MALNPVDSLYRDYVGRTVGSDVAGVVEKVGSAVLPRELTIWGSWNVGDRVAALLQGGWSFLLDRSNLLVLIARSSATTETPRPGAFAEYAILEADLAFLIPENLSFEEAATIPLSALTTAQVTSFSRSSFAITNFYTVTLHQIGLTSSISCIFTTGIS